MRGHFWQIFANSLSNNGNKLPTCPTLSNGCMSHPDRWMDLFSQELLVQVYIRRDWFGPIADFDADTNKRLNLVQFGTVAWNKMNNPNYMEIFVSLKLEAVKTWQVLSKQPFEWSPQDCWWTFCHFQPMLNAILAANSESNGQTDGVCKIQISGDFNATLGTAAVAIRG